MATGQILPLWLIADCHLLIAFGYNSGVRKEAM
jgi:hypothetical protein